MSTAVLDAPVGNRPLQVMRLHVVNPPLQLLMPWAVLLLSFVVNLLVFSLVPDSPDDARVSGGLLTIYIFTLVAHLVTMTQLFPFALSLSVTRRHFYAGSVAFVVLQSMLQGLLLTVLAAIERASDGWGLQMHFFDLPFLQSGDWFTRWLILTVPFLFFSFVSMAAGTIFKRFGQFGLWTVGLVGLVVGGAAAVLVTWLGAWGAIGRFFVDTPPLMLFAGYPAILAVLAAGVGWLFLRRATP
jgi:hypothetical protein